MLSKGFGRKLFLRILNYLINKFQEWLNTVSGKSLSLLALAQYHQAQVCEETKEIGEQLSRLKESHRLLEKCNTYLPISIHYSAQNASIRKFLDQSIKDNDFIVSF